MSTGDNGSGERPSPNSGQFKKGRSGNPRGRPRKIAVKPKFPSAQHPTRAILRTEAERPIMVTDASGRYQVPVTQAIVRSMSMKALTGGPGSVLAGRTILHYEFKEDERYHRERKESFEIWRNYQDIFRERIAADTAAGRLEAEIVPHPDDIELDWHTLEVRFLGAMNEEERASEKNQESIQDLAYEISIYLSDDNSLPNQHNLDGSVGFFMLMHLSAHLSLPPRLRRSAESYDGHLLRMSALGVNAWGNDLERRCRAADFPFIRCGKIKPPSISLMKLGLKIGPVATGSKRQRRTKA